MNNVYPIRKKIRDYSTRSANEEAAMQIRSFWAAKGYDVEAEVVDRTGWRCYGIATNLLNGLPKDVFLKRVHMSKSL